MSHRQAQKRSWLGISALALLLAGLESLSYGGCLPPTPSPCAADGVCRPNREWGHYETRWRSWPGDPTSQQQPTRADASAPGEADEQGLGPFQLPLPEQEDLRGPAKDKAARSEKKTTNDVPAEDPGLLPGPEALPPFDQQGNHLNLPTKEDAPPALPASLRQAVRSLSMPHLTTQASQITPEIRQANRREPAALGLINPASALVSEDDSEALQQAIYYETSDQE